jgi:hypothetical protein
VVAIFEPLRTTWTEPPQVHLEDIGRCKECAAYINHLCLFERTGWACSLCGCLNEYANAQNARYLGGPSARRALPELATLPDIHAYSDTHSSDGTKAAANAPSHAPMPEESRPLAQSPATVVLLDASAGAELLDLFRNTLVSALEVLPQGSRFGIATFVDEELVLYEPSANAGQNGTPTFTAWHIPLICPLIDNGHHNDQHHHHEGEVELDQVEPSVVDAVDVIPLHHFLTPVDSDKNKHQLATMIESILADLAIHTELKDRKCPLGEAIQTLLRYLSTPTGPTAAGSRLAVLLGGLPNHGRGSLACLSNRGLFIPNDNPPSGKSTNQSLPLDPYFPEVTAWGFPVSVLKTDQEDEDDDNFNDNRYKVPDVSKHSKMYSPRALAFYANAGAAAASVNVAIDVVAVLKSEKEELDVIGDLLVNKSGGLLLCYDDDLELDECSLPQDWCKLMSQPSFGHSCTIRLRCSPELKIGPCLGGRLVQDATYHDIFHVPRVYVHDTYGVELQHVASRGHQVIKSPPVVQLVVQYACIDTLSASIQRRVHIMTAVIPLADTVLDVYASMDAEVSAWALFNSVRDSLRLSSSPSSISELKQWIEKHLEARRSALKRSVGRLEKLKVKEKAYGDKGDGDGDVDAMIEQEYESFYRFMHYARAIYQRISLENGDNIGNLTCISETLPPMELATLLYPHLSRWSSPEEVSRQWLPLPQSSLMDSIEGPWIYLVDSYSDIIIYYSKAAVDAHPYPPGRNCRIMSHATALRAARRMTPSLLIVQEGDDITSLTKQHVEKVLKKFCLLY